MYYSSSRYCSYLPSGGIVDKGLKIPRGNHCRFKSSGYQIMKKILHIADTNSIDIPGGIETVIRNCLRHILWIRKRFSQIN